MVWAIKFQSAFNAFNPEGDFRGYREVLTAAFWGGTRRDLVPVDPPGLVPDAGRALDGDGNPYWAISSYSLAVSEKFHSELGVRRGSDGSFPPYGPILPHEWPKEYVQTRNYTAEAALVKYPNRMYAVTEPLRAIIERLEPGVHQFNPIRVMLPKGVEHPVPHHMMVVGRWLNAFSLADSDPSCLHDADSASPYVYSNKKSFAGVAMSAAVIGTAHLWCERALQGATFYISDQLKDEVAKAGLRLPPSYKMKTV